MYLNIHYFSSLWCSIELFISQRWEESRPALAAENISAISIPRFVFKRDLNFSSPSVWSRRWVQHCRGRAWLRQWVQEEEADSETSHTPLPIPLLQWRFYEEEYINGGGLDKGRPQRWQPGVLEGGGRDRKINGLGFLLLPRSWTV